MKKTISILITVLMLLTVGCGSADNKSDSDSQKIKHWEYIPTIEAYGLTLDNTTAHLLVCLTNEESGLIEAVDEGTAETCRLTIQKSETEDTFKELADFYRNLTQEEGNEPSDITDIKIAGYDSVYYSWQDQSDKKHNKIYVIGADVPISVSVNATSEDDYNTLSDMVESMLKTGSEATSNSDETTANEETANSKTDTPNTDDKTTTTKKREREDMNEDEIFMVMALAEKEIKNNLTYDAKKAKFSHQPEDWYMSEQDGYYTVTTTFEAPNEDGTMQKAGAVVSFTVTSKSNDGWGYKEEDVFIEWKQ